MKKVFALILVLSMLLMTGTGCAVQRDEEENTGTTGSGYSSNVNMPVTREVEPIDDDLEELNYRGQTVTILSRSDKKYNGDELWVEELMNDTVNDAVYNRNLMVSEILGVELKEVRVDGETELQQEVKKMVNSDDHTYDIVAASVAYGTPMICDGYVFNLYENGIETYLNPEKPWWSQSWIKEAELGGKLYSITGAPALSLTRLMYAVFYNKSVAQDYKIEDLYSVVNSGKWTVDYMNQLVAGTYYDLNGNSRYDSEDSYGLVMNNYADTDLFWSSFDLELLTKNSEGFLELSTGNKEKLSTAFDRVYSLLYLNSGTYYVNTEEKSTADIFSDGNVLFSPLQLSMAETQDFRNMKDDYGILPTPKYDESQDSYYTYSQDQYTVFMIPITVSDPEMSGAVLETMAYQSYKTLQPIYYDVVLRGRYANDPQSRAMLDLITENFKVDAAWIYGKQIDSPTEKIFRDLLRNGSQTLSSTYDSITPGVELRLNSLKNAILKLDY